MSDSPDLPELDACGFVQVPTSGGPPLWMTCESCGKSDHFWIDQVIHCRCGARYDHAVRPDSSTVPLDQLRWVSFDDGPKQLATLEWDTTRLALIALLVVGVVGLLAWGWLG